MMLVLVLDAGVIETSGRVPVKDIDKHVQELHISTGINHQNHSHFMRLNSHLLDLSGLFYCLSHFSYTVNTTPRNIRKFKSISFVYLQCVPDPRTRYFHVFQLLVV